MDIYIYIFFFFYRKNVYYSHINSVKQCILLKREKLVMSCKIIYFIEDSIKREIQEKLFVPLGGPHQLLPANRKLPRGHFSDSAPYQHLPITLTLVNKTKPKLKLSSTYPQPKTQNQRLVLPQALTSSSFFRGGGLYFDFDFGFPAMGKWS